MFPTNLQFVGTPIRLQQAVDSLPEPKGKVRSSPSKNTALRDKLLQIETAQLRQWKLKPAMLRRIPALARERSNSVLQEKVLAIAITSLENMDVQTLSELVSLLWPEESFRLALNAFCARQTPNDKGWFGQYYKAFRAPNPPKAIAERLIHTCELDELHRTLGLQTSNPLFQAVSVEFFRLFLGEQIAGWQWSRLLNFLESGYPLEVRQGVLHWVYEEYLGTSISMEQALSDQPLNKLLSLGQQYPLRWRKQQPEHIQTLLRGVQIQTELETWLSSKQMQQWIQLISSILSVVVHRPSGWLCAVCHSGTIVWPMSQKDERVYWVSARNFQRWLNPKLRQRMPFTLETVDGSFLKNADWVQEVKQRMQVEEPLSIRYNPQANQTKQ